MRWFNTLYTVGLLASLAGRINFPEFCLLLSGKKTQVLLLYYANICSISVCIELARMKRAICYCSFS